MQEIMMIQNAISYKRYITRVLLILAFATSLAILAKPSAWLISSAFFFILSVFFLLGKFTQCIYLDSLNLVIKYYTFFSKKELKLPIKEVELQITKESSFRSPKYFVIYVYKKRERIFSIDSRDGFMEEDLILLCDAVARL